MAWLGQFKVQFSEMQFALTVELALRLTTNQPTNRQIPSILQQLKESKKNQVRAAKER